MHDFIPLTIAAILLVGVGAQWLAWWLGLPAILPLLAVGIIAGPVTGWLNPDRLLGELLFPMVSLGVAVILFEGALTLRFAEIRGQARVVRNLVSFGALINWLLIALATRVCMDLPWSMALLFGALVVVTGPTVIVPMLRTVRPTARIAELLRWEGIVIDPIGALLAVLVFEFIVASGEGQALLHTLATFAKILAIGVLLGAFAGWLLGLMLRGHWVPEYLRNVTTLAAWCGRAFALANAVESESGLLAVTVMGMWLANMKRVPLDEVIDFKETLTVLLISVLFIVLAARLRFSDLVPLGWGALGVLLVAQFVARPLKILATTWGSTLKWQEKALLAWIAPRGIVAAAVSAIFALQLERLGHAEARTLVALTFLVILVTVILQSLTAKAVVKKLGLAGTAAARGADDGRHPGRTCDSQGAARAGYSGDPGRSGLAESPPDPYGRDTGLPRQCPIRTCRYLFGSHRHRQVAGHVAVDGAQYARRPVLPAAVWSRAYLHPCAWTRSGIASQPLQPLPGLQHAGHRPGLRGCATRRCAAARRRKFR
jgi:NhaP-type Na+/H+ or K+/H+ antiporter